MGLLDKVRDWIDGKEPDAVQQVEKHAKPQLGSKAAAFKKRLLQEIELVLREEIFDDAGGTVYVPAHFTVFLNPADDQTLQGEKRRRMESALSGHALERAQALSKGAPLTVKAIRVELRCDATLEAGEVRAQAISEGPARQDTTKRLNAPPARVPTQRASKDEGTIKDDSTIKDTGAAGVLYRLEVWRDGNREQDIPVVKRNLSVGRDSGGKAANVRLKTDDRRVSRLHFELIYEAEGRLSVGVLGTNDVTAGSVAVKKGEKKELPKGAEIVLYDFVLRPVWAGK